VAYPLLGIQEIDEQHKVLVENLQQLQAWRSKGHGYSAALNAFLSLGQYVQSHFRDEEAFMERHDFPELEEHKIHHQQLVTKLQTIEQHVMSGDDITDEMMALLSQWLIEHIGGDDMKIATYLRSVASPA
jgi:hemerythrin